MYSFLIAFGSFEKDWHLVGSDSPLETSTAAAPCELCEAALVLLSSPLHLRQAPLHDHDFSLQAHLPRFDPRPRRGRKAVSVYPSLDSPRAPQFIRLFFEATRTPYEDQARTVGQACIFPFLKDGFEGSGSSRGRTRRWGELTRRRRQEPYAVRASDPPARRRGHLSDAQHHPVPLRAPP